MIVINHQEAIHCSQSHKSQRRIQNFLMEKNRCLMIFIPAIKIHKNIQMLIKSISWKRVIDHLELARIKNNYNHTQNLKLDRFSIPKITERRNIRTMFQITKGHTKSTAKQVFGLGAEYRK